MTSLTPAILFTILIQSPGTNMNIKFRNLETGDPATVTGVRLVQRSGQTHLLLSRRDQLSEAPVPDLGAKGQMQFSGAGTLGGLPSWDAKPVQGQKGVYATLYVRAESAVSWAMFRAPAPAKDSRLHLEPFAVYDHPRFAKGQRPDQWSVTAVQYAEGKSIPVIFPRGGISPKDPPAVTIGSYSQPIQDARLVSTDTGFWLFLLMGEPGAIANSKLRKLPSGDRRPGVLSAICLNAALEPTSELSRVFGAAPIYEFDADAAPGGRLVIFATTEEGAIFAHGALEPGKPMPSDFCQVAKLQMPLVSPSVLVNAGSVHVVAIANLALPQASVIYGAVPLQ